MRHYNIDVMLLLFTGYTFFLFFVYYTGKSYREITDIVTESLRTDFLIQGQFRIIVIGFRDFVQLCKITRTIQIPRSNCRHIMLGRRQGSQCRHEIMRDFPRADDAPS